MRLYLVIYIGGYMAINLDNFTYNSDYLFEHRNSSSVETVAIGGTLAGGASVIWSSPWRAITNGATRVRGTVYIPGISNFPTITNGTFQLPTIRIFANSDYASLRLSVEVSGNNYRCIVFASNPYNFNLVISSMNIQFKVSTFIQQPRV